MIPELNQNGTKWSLSRLKRGQTTPKLETPLSNYLEQVKTQLLYVIHLAQIQMQDSLKGFVKMG